VHKVYTTVSGQTWDQIAYEVYGNEYYCDRIMDANRELLDYFVFPAGVVMQIPDLEVIAEENVSDNYPEWRAVLNE
jgi:phage tail protein X